MSQRTLLAIAVAMISKAAFADVIVGKIEQVDLNDHKISIRCERLPDVAPEESVFVTFEDNLQCELKVTEIHDTLVVANSADCFHETRLATGLLVEKTPDSANEPTVSPGKPVAVSPAPLEPPSVTWRAVFLVGYLQSSSTRLEYRTTSGKLVESGQSDGGGAPLSIGGELTMVPHDSAISVSFLGTVNKYRYKPKGADGHFTLMGMPRLEHNLNGLVPWVGLATGITTVSFGDPSVTTDGITVTSPETTVGFVLSPRVGLDFMFSRVIFGVQYAYVVSSGNLDVTASDGKNSTPYVLHWRRSWSDISLRLGFQF